MLTDAVLSAVARSITSASLIASHGAGATRVPLVMTVSGGAVVNLNEVSFPVPADCRVVGLRLYSDDGTAEDFPMPEQRFTRAGRFVVPAGDIRISARRES